MGPHNGGVGTVVPALVVIAFAVVYLIELAHEDLRAGALGLGCLVVLTLLWLAHARHRSQGSRLRGPGYCQSIEAFIDATKGLPCQQRQISDEALEGLRPSQRQDVAYILKQRSGNSEKP